MAKTDPDDVARQAGVVDTPTEVPTGKDIAKDRLYVRHPELGNVLAAAPGQRIPAWAQDLERVDSGRDTLRESQNMAEDAPRRRR